MYCLVYSTFSSSFGPFCRFWSSMCVTVWMEIKMISFALYSEKREREMLSSIEE
ncbi:hypothetical protein CSUI_007485 [Cystoisospora suis]|uniref:Uncharacterized protein n=1 Tax=Cystoisospora suis TaxID=483139 RepID=A0A2C6KDV6_9APIC|nr:hypothetical protein CSUI_007485 [Cystoisospora suis]